MRWLVESAQAKRIGECQQQLTPTEYFPDIGAKKVLHGISPYRIQRSLVNGLQDLKEASKNEGTEGCFVFDPAKEIWYSLGRVIN